MNDSAIATYFVKPHDYREFRNALAEIQRYICPHAARGGLRITRIESISDERDPNITVGFEIEAVIDETAQNSGSTESFLSAAETLAAVIDAARQDVVNREKTTEARKEKIAEITGYASRTLLNGVEHSAPKLIPNAPDAPVNAPPTTQAPKLLSLIDIERGRLRFGDFWVVFESQVAEIIREVFRKSGMSPKCGKPLDFEQTRLFVEILETVLSKLRQFLSGPFSPGDDQLGLRD